MERLKRRPKGRRKTKDRRELAVAGWVLAPSLVTDRRDQEERRLKKERRAKR